MRILWLLLITLSVLVSSGCGSAPASGQDENPAVSEPLASPKGDAIKMEPTFSADPNLQNLVEKAKEDLASRLNISAAKIALLEAKSVVWPDASLGCPQPGMMYKQVPEDGALIVLQANEITYRYHNGGSRGLFLCETVYKDPGIPPKIDIFNLTPAKSEPDSATPDNSISPSEDQ